ncbi:MarR family transcriptional regulator [Sphingobium sp. H39-3-25]|uniref:helix-turn-helix domain-containing protein n=1 Tax=Sphingobium arseniciresistens TaxID=3030834 RepID=UPI0023B95499|nr:MarR family transcriptional regulator [Sphingobium arseniciresistens]
MLVRPSESGLPGSGLAYWALMARRLREEVIGSELFSDPAWDILLDLYAALARGVRVKASSVSLIAGVPPSTCRRWVSKLIDLGLIERAKERPDQRFTYLGLSAEGREIMEAFMIRLAGKGMPPLVHQ